MTDQFFFRSDLFQIHKGEDEQTNPGVYGRELGLWLYEKFRDLGYEVEELMAEDWGWCIMCQRDPFLLWVGCSLVLDEEFPYDPDVPPNGADVTWVAFSEAEVPFFHLKSWFSKLLGRLDVEGPHAKLKKDLAAMLESEKSIELCDPP